jgi:hypothetical protein
MGGHKTSESAGGGTIITKRFTEIRLGAAGSSGGTARLKDQAIERGAHGRCMASGRAGACEACRVIVDELIDDKHSPARPIP